jgi:phosphoenolpyruvate carboxykinase (GTP)
MMRVRNNNWMDPTEAKAKMRELFRGCMKGRTLYVVPYCMGPLDSPYSRCGVEITDSAYVVLNMALMTRMGRAMRSNALPPTASFVRGSALHRRSESGAALHHALPGRPVDRELFGSGYGGNALLGKKCHALRIASWQARD